MLCLSHTPAKLLSTRSISKPPPRPSPPRPKQKQLPISLYFIHTLLFPSPPTTLPFPSLPFRQRTLLHSFHTRTACTGYLPTIGQPPTPLPLQKKKAPPLCEAEESGGFAQIRVGKRALQRGKRGEGMWVLLRLRQTARTFVVFLWQYPFLLTPFFSPLVHPPTPSPLHFPLVPKPCVSRLFLPNKCNPKQKHALSPSCCFLLPSAHTPRQTLTPAIMYLHIFKKKNS